LGVRFSILNLAHFRTCDKWQCLTRVRWLNIRRRRRAEFYKHAPSRRVAQPNLWIY